jgi:hypothetical protein
VWDREGDIKAMLPIGTLQSIGTRTAHGGGPKETNEDWAVSRVTAVGVMPQCKVGIPFGATSVFEVPNRNGVIATLKAGDILLKKGCMTGDVDVVQARRFERRGRSGAPRTIPRRSVRHISLLGNCTVP